MAIDRKPHLHETQLLQSVVAETDLSRTERQHLAQCPACRSEQLRLQRNLSRLGEMAERFTPAPRSPLRLELLEENRRPAPSRPRHGLLQWAAIAATVAVMMLGPWLLHLQQIDRVAAVKREMSQDERLLVTVNHLEKNALPAFYLEITGEEEPDAAASNGNDQAAPKPDKHSSFGSTRRPALYVETIARRNARC